MNKSSRIYVAGHNGMVGSAITRILKNQGYTKILYLPRSELNLLIQKDVVDFFKLERPEYVFLAAAKVGGIMANDTYRADFLYDNLMIQSNVIHAAHKFEVKKLLFLGSACIYPRLANQPIREEYILTGSLEKTNEPYAIAKIAGIKLCQAYYEQFGNDFVSIMPNNLYGPGDNFDLNNSHVLPALLRKFHESKLKNKKYVEVWGSGKPLREFVHVDDMAKASVYVMKNVSAEYLYKSRISALNIGSGEEISIKELANKIKKITGFKGQIKFNKEYPDGMPRKLLDNTRLKNLGWEASITLSSGLKDLYIWYCNSTK